MSEMIAKLEQLQEWLREPDHSDEFSLEDVIAWINRRPTHIIPSVIANLSTNSTSLPTPAATSADAANPPPVASAGTNSEVQS